jgi:hypothetical protein
MQSAHHQAGPTTQAESFHLTQSDEWFAAVDGQTVRCRDFDWQVHVFGIHNSGNRWWFQVGFDGPQHVSGTFETKDDRPVAVLDALTHWLETSDDTPVNAPILL